MAELQVCDSMGVSHSHFLGGPPRWTDLDRAKALAYQQLMNATCGGCGTRREEWDPKAGGHRNQYLADLDECPGCRLKHELNEQLEEDDRHSAVRVVLMPNPDAEAPREQRVLYPSR